MLAMIVVQRLQRLVPRLSRRAVLLLLLGLARWPAVLMGVLAWPSDMRAWAIVIVLMGLVWCPHIVDGKLITNSPGLDRSLKYLLFSVPALLGRRPSETAVNCAAGSAPSVPASPGRYSSAGTVPPATPMPFSSATSRSCYAPEWRARDAGPTSGKTIGWLALLLGTVASVASAAGAVG